VGVPAAAVPVAVAEVATAVVVEAAAVVEEVAGVAAVAPVVVVVPVAEAAEVAEAAATPVVDHHLLPNPQARTRINQTGQGRSSPVVTRGRSVPNFGSSFDRFASF
jgi:hypothetical protein